MQDKGLSNDLDWFATVPVSHPVVDRSAVLGDFGGIVMTETGLRLGLGEVQTPDVYLRHLIDERF